MIIIGILMTTKMLITIKAITVLFGLLTLIIGWIVLFGSWKSRALYSYWWLIFILGIVIIGSGIKSIIDIYKGIETISNLLGISILLSGLGLIGFAFLKKKAINVIKNKFNS